MGNFLNLDFAKLNLGMPYSKCKKEIKLLRRIIVVYLAKMEAEREKNGESRKYTNEEIIKMIDVPMSSGYRWIDFELKNPGSGFKPSKTGPKHRGPKKLSHEQVEELKKIIVNDTPDKYGIKARVWSRRAIIELINIRFHKTYSINHLSKVLKYMDLVLRRPAKYSIFRNEEEIKLFILVTFAEIHETVKKKGGKLFFADETHVQQDSGNLRGFTIVGKAPKLIHNPKTSGHRVCSLLIVISREGDMTYTLETEKTSAVEFIDLLENVLKDNRNTMIHIILDNARIHHAKLVKEFLKKHKRMNLYYLPPYAPEINPVEYLNQTIKVDIRNQKSMDKEELIDYCYDLMNRFKNDKATIKLCFEAKYVAYTILP